MSLYRTIICIVLALPLLSAPGSAQETPDQFVSELTEASLAHDPAKVHQLISEHRLRVKPVVNRLITEYIDRTMIGASGQVVKTLVQMHMAPGHYTVLWNEDLEQGGRVPNGLYLLELRVPGHRQTLTVSVVR